MAYTAYRVSFKDYYNRSVVVNIIKSGDLPDGYIPYDLTPSTDPLIISANGDDEDILQPMFSSKAAISIIVDLANIAFIQELSEMDEDTFGVEVEINDGLKWAGWLVPYDNERTFSYTSTAIKLTAVDFIERLKGQKLSIDGASFFYGKQKLSTIIQACIGRCWNSDLLFSEPVLAVNSRLKIYENTSTDLGSILNQLSVDSGSFNDDMGRPISCYDVVTKISMALCMRVMCVANQILFLDIPDYNTVAPTISLGIKDEISYSTTNFLIGNSENITTLRQFKEASAKFEYESVSGLLRDGYMQDWIPIGGGYRLQRWFYKPYLASQPDVYQRRVGTGRQEAPYGFVMKGETGSGLGNNYDEMAARSETYFVYGDKLTVSVTLSIENGEIIQPVGEGSSEYRIETWVAIFFYNDMVPSDSRYLHIDDLNGTQSWVQIDLTGTLFASGVFDYSCFGTGNISIAPYVFMALNRTNDVQTVDVEMTPLFYNTGRGQIYVSVSNAMSLEWTENIRHRLTSTLFNVQLTRSPSKVQSKTTKGDIVYITRDIKASVDSETREIDMNTTYNYSVNGALFTGIDYIQEDTGITIPRGTLLTVLYKYPDGPMPLLQYNAMAMMAYNFTQYKIDFEAKSASIQLDSLVNFDGLYDASIPFTSIYQQPYIQTRHEYNVRSSVFKITAISMKNASRVLSKDTLDDTHDLLETYFIT